jgi:hypothetical protein
MGGGVFDHAKKEEKGREKEEFNTKKSASTTHLFLVLVSVWYPKRWIGAEYISGSVYSNIVDNTTPGLSDWLGRGCMNTHGRATIAGSSWSMAPFWTLL